MIGLFIYLYLLQSSFVFANQLIEQNSTNSALSPTENVEDFDNVIAQAVIKQGRNRATVPQSLTFLMNFKDDGTTSFQIMQGSQIVFLDNGLCQHGQLFDPSTGRCRDVYCQEMNYKFNGTTCIPDESKATPVTYKRMSDIDISVIIVISPSTHYERENFSQRLNSQMNAVCTHDWKQMFHDTLHGYLNIDYERIKKIKYYLKSKSNHVTGRSAFTQKNQVNNEASPLIQAHSPSYDPISNVLFNNQSIFVNFDFTITDRNETSNDTLTGLHVVTLLLLATEFHPVLDFCKNYSIKVESVSIISDRNRTEADFCSYPDMVRPTDKGIIRRRIRPDGEVDYVVYIRETDTTYETGDYMYVLMISTSTQEKAIPKHKSYRDDTAALSDSKGAMKLVTICDRQPRIVGRCPDSLVMRIALCEVTQYANFSIRIKRTGRLYTNREYRFDQFRPDLYIVVCKHDTYNGTASGKKLGFVEKAPGILSTIATFLSIIALAISLVTFLLFSSLRNLPGCNTINLIIALMIGEILFLCQSLILMTRPSVCLLFALGIHFFYLASFFWMNVMAFDLWKTFSKGFSLFTHEIRERLPFYALYAWGMPVIIVLIGTILDASNARLKPCYGRFFRGCYDVCFRTKNDTPLQGCWIETGLMRFILFGCPVAIILFINFVFYALTVRNIRRGLKKVRVQVERKFQRKKQVVPGEHDVKIYMRMAVLAGFGWTIGFILFLLPDNEEGFKRYLVATVKYLFILLNATPGLFIFGVYVCNRRVLSLYYQLITRIYELFRLKLIFIRELIIKHGQNILHRTKRQLAKFNGATKKEKEKQKQDDTVPTSWISNSSSIASESRQDANHTHLSLEQKDQSLPVNTYEEMSSL